jgi:hypothetical protein
MDRSDILELMATLKLFGMRAAYDEVMATAIKRQYEPARIVGELLAAEIAEKQARSIKYQMTIAKLPLTKSLPRRRPGISTASPLPKRRSTRAWSALWQPGHFWPSSATPSWSAEPAPANRISPWPSRDRVSAVAQEAASTSSSTW